VNKGKNMQLVKKLAATALIAGLGFSATSFSGTLPPIDSYLNTYFDKSIIAGALVHDPAGPMGFAQDAAGNFLFNYTGKVYGVTTDGSAKLVTTNTQVGTVEGQAAFPMDFAVLAMGAKAFMDGVGPLPAIPASINWTCNHCNLKVGDNQYVSIVDTAGGPFDAASIEAMRMQGRAFTGLGPVEMGQVSAQSMTVRMAGCSAVVGVAGPDAGKLGTLCLNGSFTFDLAALAQGNLTGTGTSNCVTVMHTPMQMP